MVHCLREKLNQKIYPLLNIIIFCINILKLKILLFYSRPALYTRMHLWTRCTLQDTRIIFRH